MFDLFFRARIASYSFFLAVATFNGACATEAFTYEKGTTKFDEANHSFTFYPQQGNFRGLYSCAPGSNFDRSATPDELKAPHIITLSKQMNTERNGW